MVASASPACSSMSTWVLRGVRSTSSRGRSGSPAWQTRTLDTVVTNTIAGASLASNQITLPAGTYDIAASAPGHQCDEHRIAIYNVTDSTYILLGSSEQSRSTGSTDGTSTSRVNGRITLTGTKVLELRHYTTVALASSGLGVAVSTGQAEVYGEVFITAVNVGIDGAVQFALQETDIVITNNTVYQDTALSLPLSVGRHFIELEWAISNAATPQMSIQQTFSGTLSAVVFNRMVLTGSTSNQSHETALFTSVYTTTNTGVQRWTGYVDVSVAGTFTIRVKQNVSSASAVTFYAGSYLRTRKLS